MSTKIEQKLEQVRDLIAELETVAEWLEDDMYIAEARDELENQSGTIRTILEDWQED